MIRTSLLIALCLTIILTGCSKNNDFAHKAESLGLVCRVENGDGETIAEYEYNENGTLKSSWEHSDYYIKGSDAKYEYKYNNEGKLVGIKGFEPGNVFMSSLTGAMDKYIERTYSYNENGKVELLVSHYKYDEYPEINYSRSVSYLYPSDNVVTISENLIDPAANSVAYFTDFQFNADGNILEQQMYYMVSETEKRIYQISTFEYDSMKTVLNILPGPKSKNNITKRSDVVYNFDENGNKSIAYSSVFSYSYTYNPNGYPLSMTETYPNQVKKVSNYFYK